MPGNLYCDQTTPWQGVYFLTSTVKVGAVRLAHCYIVIRVVGIIIDCVSMKTLFLHHKRAVQIRP